MPGCACARKHAHSDNLIVHCRLRHCVATVVALKDQVEPLVVRSLVQHNQVHVYPAVLSGFYVAIVATHVSRHRFKRLLNVVFDSTCHY